MMRNHLTSVFAIFVLAMSTVAMGATAPAVQAKPATPPLVIGSDYGSPTFTDSFNPFSPTARQGWIDIFEPLMVIDTLTGKVSPWLARGYHWVNPTQLVFTIRSGVKWNDGRPFSAQDVVFTFNLLHRYPALDTNGIWTVLSKVFARGNQVYFDFTKPDVPEFTLIAQTPIVPAFQWSTVGNPVKFTDTSPVGTGPFMVGTFQPSEYTLKPNPYYWQKNLVKVSGIDYPAMSGAQTDDLLLSEGKFDQAVLFEPGIQKVYVDKNPKYYHYWFPLSSPVALSFNLTEAPFNNVKFRQAMDYAINKEKIYIKGEYGYEPPANQSLLPPSLDKSWLDQSVAKKYAYNYSPSKAQALLASIGYHKKNGKLIGPNGKQLSFTLECPTGWTDWIQDMSIIQTELGQLGIKVNIETPSVATDYNDVETGHYQAALVYGWTESNPYFVYDYIMSSSESAPVGQAATFNANTERFNDPQANTLISELAATTNVAKQHQIVDQLEQISFSQVPIVGLVSGASWNEYQTNHFVGWPTLQHPYADPSQSYPDDLMILTHLRPAN
jgi:peptide/nickel transport system substrate-binding protein